MINEESATVEDKPIESAPETKPETETTSEDNTPIEKAKGLSLRDALEVSLETHKEEGTEEKQKSNTAQQATTKRARKHTAVVAEESAGVGTRHIEPPAEWDAEDKADFVTLSDKQKQALLKIHNKRQTKIEEIRRGQAELEWLRELEKEATPVIKAMGEKVSPRELIIKSLKLRNEWENGDPKVNVAAYLKAKNLAVPKELLEQAPGTSAPSEEITSLQKDLNSVKAELAQRSQAEYLSTLGQTGRVFEQELNAAGTPRFPSWDNSPEGLQLASNVGSLVSGGHQHSKAFDAYIEARIPGASLETKLKQAYLWFGGKVDDSVQTTKPIDAKKHIAIANRAASSVPGKGSSEIASGRPKKFGSFRDAAASALADLRARETE